MDRHLILASGSPYRRKQLEQLQLPFECIPPHINETALAGERPADLARRLAEEKARALADTCLDALIIGSDQVAECGGRALGKPGNSERAFEQLKRCSGRQMHFHTGISLLDSRSGRQRTEVEIFTVHFRRLGDAQIRHYIALEEPYDCAGSFKVEGLGITLFEKMEGSDINSLIGLPLIRLIDLLQAFGVDPLTHAEAPFQGTSGGQRSSSEK